MKIKTAAKAKSKPKLSDIERHARFIETARKIEASEDTADFEKVFKKIVKRRTKATS